MVVKLGHSRFRVYTPIHVEDTMLKTYYNCPISDEPVHEVLPRADDFVEFFCPTCGKFRISKTSIKPVKNRSRLEREALLTEARLSSQGGESVPVISGVH